MIDETYAVLSEWDFEVAKKANLDRLRETNFIGARSDVWLRQVAKVLNRRLDPGGRDRALTLLAKGGLPIETWKPILLWHITRDEFLLRDFLVNWLFAAREDGRFRIHPEDVRDHLRSVPGRGGVIEHDWTDATIERVAAGLLKMSVDFDLLTGSVVKEFSHYHLPEASFLYLVRAILDQEKGSPVRMLASHEWKMFLMGEEEVRAELLRLHQYRLVHMEAAGSLVQLSFDTTSVLEYAKEMVA